MKEPHTVAVETEHAGTYPNATSSDLQRLVQGLCPASTYLIVRRSDSEEVMQAACARSTDSSPLGGFVVERVEGERVRQTSVASSEEVYEMLAAWAFGFTSDMLSPKTAPSTTPVIDVRGSTRFNRVDAGCAAVFTPFALSAVGANEDEAYRAVLAALDKWTNESPENAVRFSGWAREHLIAQ